ncbi:MAG: hypothetical protein JWR32_892 [Mycobacterium sp.]|jgi:hypothetical protein|nr:hypothetical protein [Mycobacterium sp.]
MGTRLNYMTPLLVAGAAVAAIVAAPVAAANQQSCVASAGGSTQCQSPGNVQIKTNLPPQSAGARAPYIGSTYGPFFSYNR